jgi:hypothetical protein
MSHTTNRTTLQERSACRMACVVEVMGYLREGGLSVQDRTWFCVRTNMAVFEQTCQSRVIVHIRNNTNCVNVSVCVCVCVCCFFQGGIDIKPCRSERNWLKYITEEDDQTYFNCPCNGLFYGVKLNLGLTIFVNEVPIGLPCKGDRLVKWYVL